MGCYSQRSEDAAKAALNPEEKLLTIREARNRFEEKSIRTREKYTDAEIGAKAGKKACAVYSQREADAAKAAKKSTESWLR